MQSRQGLESDVHTFCILGVIESEVPFELQSLQPDEVPVGRTSKPDFLHINAFVRVAFQAIIH